MSTQNPTGTPKRTYSLATVLVIAVLASVVGAFFGSAMSKEPSAPPTVVFSPSPTEFQGELGEQVQTVLGNEVTLFSAERSSIRPVDLPAGTEVWIAEVEWCASTGQDPVPVDNLVGLFALHLPDDTRISSRPMDVGPDTLAASSGQVAAGDCVKGKVSFAVPKGSKPDEVLFSGTSSIRWPLGQN